MKNGIMLLALSLPIALALPAAQAHAGGTCKTFVRNASTQTAYVWVDNGGRGLSKDIDTKDGRGAQRVGPNEVGCASETNQFDCPTIRIYDAAGNCIYAKEVKYIPLFGDPSHWKWTGSSLEED